MKTKESLAFLLGVFTLFPAIAIGPQLSILSAAQKQTYQSQIVGLFEPKTARWKGLTDEKQAYAALYALTVKGDAKLARLAEQFLDRKMEKREGPYLVQMLAEGYAAFQKPEYLKTAEKLSVWKKYRTSPALLKLYDVTGNDRYLKEALEVGQGQNPLEAARAYLELYVRSADRSWLPKAASELRLIPTSRQKDVEYARIANLLFHVTGEKGMKEKAQDSLRSLAIDAAKAPNEFRPDLLLAAHELSNDPIHVTIVGKKGDPAGLSLFKAALKYPAPYRRLEWWDRAEGPLPNPDVNYPTLPTSAAFACSGKSCSLPVLDPKDVAAAIARVAEDP
jgi:uncharacterized protein YyaL (SSP411 family)